MPHQHRPGDGTVSPTQSRLVEKVCERFEEAWQANKAPRLEDFLNEVPEPERGSLLPALLQVELSYRAGEGQSVLPDEYEARFPGHAEHIAAAFHQFRVPVIDSSRGGSLADTKGQPHAQEMPVHAEEEEIVPPRMGRYSVRRQLGRGGFGAVWLADDEELQRQVAIKVPRRDWLATPEGVSGFLREARIVAGLRHPGIVTVYDVGRLDDGGCFVVMEFVNGRSLAEEIKAARPSFERSAELIEQVATAVHHAHKHGLVHRDLKPANILLDASGRPYVADFGLALREEEFSRLWRNAGTPAYMSPEQARGEGHLVDARSDIYSLGVMLFELLVGRRPYRQSTLPDLLDEIATVEVRPPRQFNDSIPKELDRICVKALAKRVADRYSTASDLADDLRHWLSAERQSAAPAVSSLHDRGTGFALAASDRGTTDSGTTGIGTAKAVSALGASATAADSAPRIVPKGLRSFDAHDADFFLQLLPGPTDRDGLPEGLRFWKTQIEETDTDRTFRVGLIYGPSGCGKSSFVKAGLLPRLANHVQHLYLEATSDDTEPRLAKLMQKSFPELPVGSLVEALAALRRGAVPGAPPKLLLVLDQFEQWLHARLDEPGAELLRALRQCDGGRVQGLVLVRDDFWMAATRFMRELDLRLVERQNSAAVDLFDPVHARRVLFEFGRAFRRLPNNPDELSAEQERFLREALAGLVEDGKVVPVRLALFAEMVKGKPWNPATLRALGGIEGVGVTFLEEMFSASTAPPAHRLHERAARAVLAALLPELGSDIKGHKHSRNELLAASGYAARLGDFDELLQILDGELRLITPSDADVLGESSLSRVAPSDRGYQLTHDYLVPSLRDWLTRKQRETRRGRAHLRLAERAAAYQARPDPRQLPGWWEWANILLYARRLKWTPSERTMMRSATRRRLFQATAATILAVIAGLSGLELRRQVTDEHQRTMADGVVRRLLVAPLQSVPAIVAELEPYRRHSEAKLRAVLAPDGKGTDGERLRAAVGLLAVDPSQSQAIYEALLAAPADETRVLISVLESQSDKWTGPLWARLSDTAAPAASRLRAAMALAAYDPPQDAKARERWQATASFVVDEMLAEARQNPSQYESLVAGVAPAGECLTEPLGVLFRDGQCNVTDRELATTILARYAASDIGALVDLVNDAQPEHFRVLFPVLEKQPDKAISLLTAELQRKAAPDWHDVPMDPGWTELPSEIATKLEAADGLAAERFALVQTLPLEDFEALAIQMAKSGYRPIRLRPHSTAEDVRVAAVWRRDGLAWQFAVALSADELAAHDKELQAEGFVPVDVAGYSPPKAGDVDQKKDGLPGSSGGHGNNEASTAVPSAAVFSALWVKQVTEPGAFRLYVDLANPYPQEIKQLRENGFGAAALEQYCDAARDKRYAILLRKSAPNVWRWDNDQRAFESEVAIERLQVDVSICEDRLHPPERPAATVQLALAEKAVAEKPDDVNALYQRGVARYQAGDDVGAIEDLTLVTEKAPQFGGSFQFRAQAHARLRHSEQARADLTKFAELSNSPSSNAYLDCVVSARLGDEDAGLGRLEAGIAQHLKDARFLYDAACACAVVAGVVAENYPDRRAQLRARALDLLTQAIDQGYDDFNHLRADDDFADVRELPGFQAIVARGHLERRYSSVFETSETMISAELHGLTPAAHLARCRELAAQGYRPAAISLAVPSESEGVEVQGEGTRSVPAALVAASVWHLPRVADGETERTALRQANAAVALLRLGEEAQVWPLFVHNSDPRLRSWLVHRLGPYGVPPMVIIKRLFHGSVVGNGSDTWTRTTVEQAKRVSNESQRSPDDVLMDFETSIRRALILALGEFDDLALPPTERATLLPGLVDLYVNDPDAGIHAAVAWLVRRWGSAAKLAEADAQLRGQTIPSEGKRWYVNSQGQTMVVINGPVEFVMGSPANEPNRDPSETIHRERIGRSFAISAHEVTVEQLKRWQPSLFFVTELASTGDCPGVVLWGSVATYCNWLSEQEGLQPCYELSSPGVFNQGTQPTPDYLSRNGYRIPTEAEWEFACRAGATTSRFYGPSERLLDAYASSQRNSRNQLREVGSLKPNDLGLFDVLGNVREYCGNAIPAPYKHQRLDRPHDDDVDVAALTHAVMRGGSMYDGPSMLRAASRVWAGSNNGFRLARSGSFDNIELAIARGEFAARKGRWRDAADEFSRVLEARPEDDWLWYQATVAQSLAGNTDVFRSVCQRLLKHFSDTRNVVLADRAAKACLLRVDGLDDRSEAARLAEFAAVNGATHSWKAYFFATKALAELRDGRSESALEWVARSESTGALIAPLAVLDKLIATLAHHHSKRPDDAVRCYKEGAELFHKHVPQLEGGDLGPGWIDWAVCEAIRREAEGLIAGANAPMPR